jgi:hypothetical protein
VLSGIILLAGMALLAGINLHDFFLYAFADNFGAGSATDHSLMWRLENLSEKFFYSELLLFYPLLITYFFIKKRTDTLGLWLICAFIGINVIGIYDRAHLKEILPVLCLVSALAINHLIESYGLPVERIVLIIWVVFFPKLLEPLVNLKKLLTGTKEDTKKYCQPPYPKPDGEALKQMGWWVRSNTGEGEKVLVAGYGAVVQAYSERISPAIYFNVTQTRRAKERFYQDLSSKEPGMVLIPASADYAQNVDPDLRLFINDLVAKDYHFRDCLYGYRIYQNKNIQRR